MKTERVVIGKCGTCPMFGGTIVTAMFGTQFYATNANSSLNIPLIVSSCDKKLMTKHGIKQFSTYQEAHDYATGKTA
jgi:hypothetical protein